MFAHPLPQVVLTRMTVDTNNPAIEDDDLSTTAPNPADDDLSTTAPNPPNEDGWRMPEPVFRRTSGKLPQGYEREVMSFSAENSEAEPMPATILPPSPVVKPKSSVLKLILVLLGMGAMIAFLIVFLTVVYFLFLR